mgnify:CR=1 FL=1
MFDGLNGLEEAFKSVYPKADVQRCVVHKVRNTLNKVRKKDQIEVAEDLKLIYRATIKEAAAIQAFHEFEKKWSKKYAREVQSWEKDLDVLLKFMKYPLSIRCVIYTTNEIERTIKDIRKRLKTINSLTSIEAAEKITYLTNKTLMKNGRIENYEVFKHLSSSTRNVRRKILKFASV